MHPKIKIIISILFVALVAFLAGHFFWKSAPKKTPTVVTAPAGKKVPTPAPSAGGRLAIILDDWGLNPDLVDPAIAIGRPLTLSVLPHLAHSREIAERAHASGLGVMLHMPMQPKGKNQPMEPHTIRTTTSDSDILNYLQSALSSVPYVEGVNNHQGSAATSDPRVMNTVISLLKKKGLFFVDSKVIATTVAGKIARENGVPTAQRDVFIDNIAEVGAIKIELRSAVTIALKHGQAVVIGHDKKPTLEAIRQMLPEFDKNGVKLVLVKELVR